MDLGFAKSQLNKNEKRHFHVYNKVMLLGQLVRLNRVRVENI